MISVLVLLAVASLDTDEWQREARVWHAAFSLQAPAIPSQAEAELSKLPKRTHKQVSKTPWGFPEALVAFLRPWWPARRARGPAFGYDKRHTTAGWFETTLWTGK